MHQLRVFIYIQIFVLDTLAVPWRVISKQYDDPWSEEFKDELLNKLSEIKPNGGINFLNVLLLGQTSAGKSSFVNTIATAVCNTGKLKRVRQVYSGAAESTTLKFEAVPLQTRGGVDLKIRLFDCCGLHIENGICYQDIKNIIQGHVHNGYKIENDSPITEDNSSYIRTPTLEDKMHCLLYVMDVSNPPEHFTEEGVRNDLMKLKKWLRLEDVPQFVLCSKVDCLGISSIKEIFHNKDVQNACTGAAHFMELPPKNALPISNYYEEMTPTLEKDILALYCLWTFMDAANDYVSTTTRANAPKGFYKLPNNECLKYK